MNDKEYVEKITNKVIDVVIKEIHKNELKIEEIMEKYPEIEYGYRGVLKADKFKDKNIELQKLVRNIENSKAAESKLGNLTYVVRQVINELYEVKETARTYWDAHEQNHVQHIIDRLENALHVD